MRRNNIGMVLALIAAGTVAAPAKAATPLSDEDISQAYIYLLGRLLVTRQQQLDFQEGFKWNELIHRKPGAVDWPNPNLDVAYSEAWVAVDETSCTIVTVPEIADRYYTVQFLNGWGETLANINERVFPNRRSGDFAMCLQGAKVEVPSDALRIDLPVPHSRVLARVALGDDPDRAVALQQMFTLRATGTPKLPDIPKTPIFELEHLPGAEAFDAAAAALESGPDTNPGLEPLQAQVRSIATAVRDNPDERERVDGVIKQHAFPELAKAGATIGHGIVHNGWARPGVVGEYGLDYLTRTLVNNGGIWANIKPEVLYYRGGKDESGEDLTGDHVYKLTFPKDALPARFAKYFWSVIAVDNVHFRVLPNASKRYLLNEQTHPRYAADGSLTLYFAAEKPAEAPDGNWLPIPKGQKYRLTFRFYGPLDGVANGTYWPPALVKAD
ncbi:hypothetical protein FHT72_003387 [Rhizobium sp. BK077]|uniref:DUF1214 domain-containing protein n=1 Tax=Rhizobium TaxID=379 RepID=UPI0007B53C0A|nr:MULTISPECIES: DUF1214 domain-containing protein [Rhizobium]KZS51247.1 hypothetical protein AS890_04410 [Rhizobium anhuiense bv. trifolii]MBB3299832.1 hypothetical protein [Rhizobium sp. BK112]MBB3368898.1 hypothetical protein [Rhizobium sp. BK077]MBB4179723.1 hypothetical protein [Rhizobium sp. BK109]